MVKLREFYQSQIDCGITHRAVDGVIPSEAA